MNISLQWYSIIFIFLLQRNRHCYSCRNDDRVFQTSIRFFAYIAIVLAVRDALLLCYNKPAMRILQIFLRNFSGNKGKDSRTD